MFYNVYEFKPFPLDMGMERKYCSICQKTIRIVDDDLSDVYSTSDYCLCHLMGVYD